MTAGTGMTTTSLTTLVKGRWGMLRLERSDGKVGWGQFGLNDPDVSAILLHRHLAPHLLGKELPQPEVFTAQIEAATYKHRGVHLWRAIAGVDAALWDLRGQDAQQPVWTLCGGRGDPVPLYASSMSRHPDVDGEVDRFARMVDHYGFRALKAKIGPRLGQASAGHDRRTQRLCDQLDRRFGHLVRKVDANGSWDAATAIAVGRDLEARGYAQFEEPCPFYDLESTGQVADALDIPVSGGEQDGGLEIFARMARERLVDIVQPDVGYIGGFTRARQAAALAAAAGLLCMPHSSNPSCIHTYSLHLVASIPNAGHFLERSIEDLDGRDVPCDPPPIRDGCAIPPQEPGWGLRLRPAWVDGAEVRESRSDAGR